MKVIGSFISPYVRKVLVCLELKGVAYEIDPIVPFFGSEEFSRLSPLRRVPVLVTDDVVLRDSTVIVEYLEDVFPLPALLPWDSKARARARWLEEFADTRLGELFIWGLFYPKVVHPFVWGESGDQKRIENCLSTEIPGALDYLEGELPERGYLFDEIGVPDISIASFFRNAGYAGFEPCPDRWPRTAGFVRRVLAHPAFERIGRLEQIQMNTPPEQRRQLLADAGVKLSPVSCSQSEPVRGIMRG